MQVEVVFICDFWDSNIFDASRNIPGLGGMCSG